MRRAFFLSIPLLLSSAACTYDNGDARRAWDPPLEECGPATPLQSTIDVDRQIQADPGEGAGLYIEYASGGHWQLRTTCDTLRSGETCMWDVLVIPEQGSSIRNVVGADLEADDVLREYPNDASIYQLGAYTSSDFDTFSFDSDPGATVRVDALLENRCALPYVFWVGDGALHPGAPSNPIDLTPSAE